jgi:sugar/nucleoside kinase (ribokinase family)
MKPGDVNWSKLFREDGVRWLHTGGIFSALSESTRQVAAEAVKAAHEAGTIVSYDLNFRSKLWSSKDAIATTKPPVPYIDCLIGNEEDFEQVLGYEAEGADVHKAGARDVGPFKKMVERVAKDYPNSQVVGTTLGTMSGVDGRYVLPAIPAGTVTIQVRRIGYSPKTVTGILLDAGRTLEQNITIAAATIPLAAQTVTAAAERGSVNEVNEP